MTNPYPPPPPPKRLVRSTRSRVIGGVCGGLAEYLNMDPTLVRILTVLISLFTGVPVILYIIALFVIPEDTSGPPAAPSVGPPPSYSGAEPPAYAQYPPPRTDDTVWGQEGPPWEQRQPEPVPVAEPPLAPAAAAPAPPTPEPEPGPMAPSEPEAPVAPPVEDEKRA